MTPFRRCSGCPEWFTHADWHALECVGLMHVETGYTLELRNCNHCHSTVAIVVQPVPAEIAELLNESERDAA